MDDNLIATHVSRVVLDQFQQLPPNGKPKTNEWTVIAGFVAVAVPAVVQSGETTTRDPVSPPGIDPKNCVEVLSLATGTKCLGSIQRSPALVSDSHAEVLARRLLNCFFLHEIHALTSTKGRGHSKYFEIDVDGRLRWIESSHTIYLFVSQLPCGDAVICDKDDDGGSYEDGKKSPDINRTGAKPLPGGPQDSKSAGKGYHSVGVARTKPGRGAATDCMSCSDKISRWIACGVQNKLVSIFLASAIAIHGVVFGGKVFNRQALSRALIERHGMPLTPLRILHTDEAFKHSRTDETQQRCSTSILYVCGTKKAEVAVDGRKHGITKKHLNTPVAELSICRRRLFRKTLDLIEETSQENNSPTSRSMLDSTYAQLKNNCPPWMAETRKLFDQRFPGWSLKTAPDFAL